MRFNGNTQLIFYLFRLRRCHCRPELLLHLSEAWPVRRVPQPAAVQKIGSSSVGVVGVVVGRRERSKVEAVRVVMVGQVLLDLNWGISNFIAFS